MLLTEARRENKIKLLAVISSFFFFPHRVGWVVGVGNEKRSDAVVGRGASGAGERG